MYKARLSKAFLPALAALVLTLGAAAARAQDNSLWPASHRYVEVDEAKVESILSQMSNKEKVGQLVMAEIRHVTPADVRRYKLGGILNGGGAFPKGKKKAKASDWVNLAQAFHDASIAGGKKGDVAVPVIWGTDAVHGHNNVFGATIFPHNIGLGATRNPELLEKIGEATAAEVSATGIYWTFAPTLAVPKNLRWGRSYEGFSEDPQLVAELGAALVRGLQGDFSEGVLGRSRVIGTAKHFIGDGGTYQGVDQGNTRLDEKALRYDHGEGYITTLGEGVQTVMASFSSWNGEKLHGQKYLLTDVLKDQLGFDGFVLGDWNGHGQVPGCRNGSCAASINAGVDMIMVPEDWLEFYESTLKQVKKGEISEARLDDAVRRILRVKMRAGLFDNTAPNQRQGAGDDGVINSPAHRAIAQQAVRESLVLLKNNDSVLPLNAGKSILVVGESARKIENQMGGWSLSWQGTGNTNSDFPQAVSILEGVTAKVAAAGGQVSFSRSGEFEARPDAAIVVFGEKPYAEGPGDQKNLKFKSDQSHMRMLNSLKEQGIPTVAVFLSGRPLWMNPELNASDAFVAAWLPGSEAGSIADILFCDTGAGSACDFKGTLPFAWPSTLSNTSRQEGMALFPMGYGLSYGDQQQLAALNEVLDEDTVDIERQFLRGWSQAPYEVMLQSGAEIKRFDQPKVAVNSDALTMQIIDRELQEDAVRVSFNGKAPSAWILQTKEPENWLPAREQKGFLTLDTRLLKKDKKQPIYLSSLCGGGCRATLDLTPLMSELDTKSWTSMAIELSCLEKSGLNLEQVDKPVVLSSPGKWSFEMGVIGIKPDLDANAVRVPCPI